MLPAQSTLNFSFTEGTGVAPSPSRSSWVLLRDRTLWEKWGQPGGLYTPHFVQTERPVDLFYTSNNKDYFLVQL